MNNEYGYFKAQIDYKGLEEDIYTQFAKTMAKNVDIDLAKTPLVDLLTGYTRYRILQSKIDKANELLQLLHYKFDDSDSIHNEIQDIQKVLKEDK